jgi:hypothetical protein
MKMKKLFRKHLNEHGATPSKFPITFPVTFSETLPLPQLLTITPNHLS